MVEQFANSGYPDQTLRAAASDLGLHCLPVTRFGVSFLQQVKENVFQDDENMTVLTCSNTKTLQNIVRSLLLAGANE